MRIIQIFAKDDGNYVTLPEYRNESVNNADCTPGRANDYKNGYNIISYSCAARDNMLHYMDTAGKILR